MKGVDPVDHRMPAVVQQARLSQITTVKTLDSSVELSEVLSYSSLPSLAFSPDGGARVTNFARRGFRAKRS